MQNPMFWLKMMRNDLQRRKIRKSEIKKIIDDCYKRATKILKDNIDKLHLMSESLVELETLDTAQIDDIMAGAKPRRESDDDSAPKNTGKKSSSIEEPANQT